MENDVAQARQYQKLHLSESFPTNFRDYLPTFPVRANQEAEEPGIESAGLDSPVRHQPLHRGEIIVIYE